MPPAVRGELPNRQPGQNIIEWQPIQIRIHVLAIASAIAHRDVAIVPNEHSTRSSYTAC